MISKRCPWLPSHSKPDNRRCSCVCRDAEPLEAVMRHLSNDSRSRGDLLSPQTIGEHSWFDTYALAASGNGHGVSQLEAVNILRVM